MRLNTRDFDSYYCLNGANCKSFAVSISPVNQSLPFNNDRFHNSRSTSLFSSFPEPNNTYFGRCPFCSDVSNK